MVSDLLQRSFFILIIAFTASKDLLVEAVFYAVSSGASDIHLSYFTKKYPSLQEVASLQLLPLLLCVRSFLTSLDTCTAGLHLEQGVELCNKTGDLFKM